MLRLIHTAALLAAIALPAPASASFLSTGHNAADRAMSTFNVPLPSEAVHVHRAPCPDAPHALGCALEDETGSAHIYFRGRMDRFVLAHEVGHVFLDQLDGHWKGAITDRLGYPTGTMWAPARDHECAPYGTARCPYEKAADAYASCALNQRPTRMVGRGARRREAGSATAYGYRPTRRQFQRMCRLLNQAASETVG